MSASTEIIEKIKKLLRLSRSSNPHEAQLAMQRALQLARDHDVQVEGLNPDEQAKEKAITHQDTKEVCRINYVQRYAVEICKRFFRVSVIEVERISYRSPTGSVWKLSLVGTASDIEIAKYIYGFLTHHFAHCWNKHRGRLRNRHAFVDGMFQGLYSKLKESEPKPTERTARGTELVLSAHKNYIGSFIGKTTAEPVSEPDGDARAARYSGYVHGRQTNIATALKPSEQPTPLALR